MFELLKNMEGLYQIFKKSTGVCTDTRKVYPGCLFIALKGDNFDGNQYVAQALNSGAFAAITDDSSIKESLTDSQVTLVDDCLSTLQQLASHHRDQLSIPIIGITGTNGKTTTKELCHTVLSSQYSCYATKGNLNNHIGVPLSILEIEDEHQMAIIEMGANHIEEIAELCAIAKPTVGIITNIGKAHLEGYGSFENIIKTKNELYDYIKSTNGRIIYNLDDAILKDLVKNYYSLYSYSRLKKDANISYSILEGELCAGIRYHSLDIRSQLFGGYNAENIACSVALGTFFDVSIDRMETSISSYEPGNNRSQLMDTGSNQLILDAYNANPTSMMNAVDQFVLLATDRPKWLILGDMLELGEYSKEEHLTLINHLAKHSSQFEKCFLVGKEFESIRFSKVKNLVFLNSVDDLREMIKDWNIESKLIFLKGSRGIHLEKLIDLF